MIKYPSINQFSQIIRDTKFKSDYKGKDENGEAIFKRTDLYPILDFIGHVKIHGTNSGIIKYKDQTGFTFQSRERELELTSDNAGFMMAMSKPNALDFFEGYCKNIEYQGHIGLYGEWSGGNIQASVAVNGLPKMFVAFAVNIDDKWFYNGLPTDFEKGFYSIEDFTSYKISIDFNSPELAQNKLIEISEAVEAECPVGKHFGKLGIGEGVVWTQVSSNGTDQLINFKVKGEKHTVTKCKTLAPIDIELVNSMQEFVDNVCSEARLRQGLSYFKENNIEQTSQNIGQFLKWLNNDILKEETPNIVANQFEVKKIIPMISKKAVKWYQNQV